MTGSPMTPDPMRDALQRIATGRIGYLAARTIAREALAAADNDQQTKINCPACLGTGRDLAAEGRPSLAALAADSDQHVRVPRDVAVKWRACMRAAEAEFDIQGYVYTRDEIRGVLEQMDAALAGRIANTEETA